MGDWDKKGCKQRLCSKQETKLVAISERFACPRCKAILKDYSNQSSRRQTLFRGGDQDNSCVLFWKMAIVKDSMEGKIEWNLKTVTVPLLINKYMTTMCVIVSNNLL